ncbi:ABC transporter permease [Actinophytocola xinjiangensis]|uniref:ABC transporter permease n=1 Tax=Actinophytocola xinjiangensis TaxID=485602 RepID=A0A7Z0WK82_9PSEU|nr:ABC transporter permease [Actinophytocola xinjiangensis]OLF09321.1 ABC transporter permease [Actinophytocola xinjiangensis]
MPRPARLRPSDVVRVGGAGLRARPLRVVLSALGIAIGIAAMTAVVGVSASSRSELDRQLAELGTNLLTVSPGTRLGGGAASLPPESVDMIARVGPVRQVAAAGEIPDAKVYRNDRVPSVESGGLTVRAATLDLPAAVGVQVADGTWLNAATARYPAAVLGATTARQLGLSPGTRVWAAGQWFTVVGVLAPAALAPELDSATLVGWPVAQTHLDFDGHPTTVYTRTADDAVEPVRAVLAATANPSAPGEVLVSRPSDALAARQATDRAFTGLLLGLGAVALLVGGVGVANTMVISVLERRAEIGLRRSLGATRGQVRGQFVVESLLLSLIGGVCGVVVGIGVTGGYAGFQEWPVVVPVWVSGGGVVVTLVVGAVAGLYPAVRAARLSPTEALAV